VRKVLMNHSEGTVRIGGKGVSGSCIEPGPVDASAYRDRCHYLAPRIVGNGHQTATASAEQTMMSGVDGHGDWLLAWRGGPAPRHRCCLRVDLNHLACV